LQLATTEAPGRVLTQNTPKHAVLRKDVPFQGREHNNLIFRPHFPEVAPFSGPFLTEQNFRLKSLNNENTS